MRRSDADNQKAAMIRLRNLIGRAIYILGFPGVAGWWDAGTDDMEYRRRKKSQR